MANYYLYFLTSKMNDVLYTGVTNNLERRLYEHKNDLIKGFTSRYRVHKLVYFEVYENPTDAINREKPIKKWRREKKDHLVNQFNPDWKDLSEEWHRPGPPASLGMTRKTGAGQ